MLYRSVAEDAKILPAQNKTVTDVMLALTEEDNSVREIGKSVISCFEDSISEVEFDAKNQILIAMTGYSLQEFLV